MRTIFTNFRCDEPQTTAEPCVVDFDLKLPIPEYVDFCKHLDEDYGFISEATGELVKGNFENVQFILKNDTDSYYVQAELNADEGIYYVVDHSSNPEDATHFVPVESNGKAGKIIIKGLEDDTYTMTEIRTDNGYVLLKDDIEIVISQVETTDLCDIYESDI